MLKVLAYSANHITGAAIKHICGTETKDNVNVFFVSDAREIPFYIKDKDPDYIIMDAAPRQFFYLIYTVRRHFQSIPFVCVQERFLFSDYICAEFFGRMVLSDYNSLLSIQPELTPYDFIADDIFAGPFFSGGVIQQLFHFPESCLSHDQLRNEMNAWLRERIKWIIPSDKCMTFLDSLLNEEPLCTLKARKNISIRQQYYYRTMVMKCINIRSFTRDFIASLKF